MGPRPESLEPLRCLSTGKTVIYHTPYSPKYAAAGDGSLTDGLRGGWNYGDRRWLGWLDTDVDLVVDLGERQPVRRIAADFTHHALDIGPELLGRVRDAFRGLKEQGKLRHGGGTFDYGEWAVRL